MVFYYTTAGFGNLHKRKGTEIMMRIREASRLIDMSTPMAIRSCLLCVALVAACAVWAETGVWCYKPYEYEAWMLQRMQAENDRGVLYVGYPGKYLHLDQEPAAFFSSVPVAGYEPIPGTPDEPPHRRERPTKEMPLKFSDGIYDLGHIDIGYVTVEAEDRPMLFVGESLPEVRNTDARGFEQSLLMIPVGPGKWRSDIPLSLRYFRFTTKIRKAHFLSQVDWREPSGKFICGDARKEKLWRTGVETIRVCTRTFLVDGVKRDRLPWAGDLVVAMLAQAYSFGDSEPIKRELAAIGSGDETQGHVNGIAAYSLWWVIAHDLLQRYFGEGDYLKLHYPKIRMRLREIVTHEDERGFFARDLGWNFLDWTDRKGAGLTSEITLQVIYFAALRAAERLARRQNDGVSAEIWRTKAETLRRKILSVGMDRTRHARALAIVFGLVEGETARRYAKELAADDLPSTVTPYMSTFEVTALAKGGEPEAALKKFESVWGEMVDFGVDTYWEGWDHADKGDDIYMYYGRPFGKSLCHAWSSGPAFLIPGVFLGIAPVEDGWAKWESKPLIPRFAPNARVTVPTKNGPIELSFGGF